MSAHHNASRADGGRRRKPSQKRTFPHASLLAEHYVKAAVDIGGQADADETSLSPPWTAWGTIADLLRAVSVRPIDLAAAFREYRPRRGQGAT